MYFSFSGYHRHSFLYVFQCVVLIPTSSTKELNYHLHIFLLYVYVGVYTVHLCVSVCMSVYMSVCLCVCICVCMF